MADLLGIYRLVSITASMILNARIMCISFYLGLKHNKNTEQIASVVLHFFCWFCCCCFIILCYFVFCKWIDWIGSGIGQSQNYCLDSLEMADVWMQLTEQFLRPSYRSLFNEFHVVAKWLKRNSTQSLTLI